MILRVLTLLCIIGFAGLVLNYCGHQRTPADELADLGLDVAYQTAKTLACSAEANPQAAAKHRRLMRAYRAELFQRFDDAAATAAVQRGLDHYRDNPVSC